MKKNLLRILICVLCLCLAFTTLAACNKSNSAEEDGFVITVNEETKTAVVTKYEGGAETVTIHKEYKKNKVVAIADNAFEDNDFIKKVIVSENVTKIGEYAFKNCSALKEVELPDGIISVGFTAFIDCKELTYNTEGSINYLGNANNPYVLLVSCDKGAIEVTVNDDCKVIGVGAFENCLALQKVILAKRINYVDGYVFSGTSLKILDYYGTEEDWKKINLDENWLTGSSVLGISAYGGIIKLVD